MPFTVEIDHPQTINDYEAVAHLAEAVRELRERSAEVIDRLEGRRLWMVSSTAKGGGVAELLPGMVRLLGDLGIATEWVVIESDRPEFFELTKRLHNLLHGAGDPGLGSDDRELYEAVNRANAEELAPRLADGDVLVVHDPQPMPLAGYLAERLDLTCIWRCHIGLDEENAATRAAWELLAGYCGPYARAVFSAPEYVPSFLAERAVVIPPGIDPLGPKNREMHLHDLVRVLGKSALAILPGPMLRPPFTHRAQRLQADGSFRPAIWPEDIGLLVRPIVTQVSRWDRLKGFLPLLHAFAELKRRARDGVASSSSEHSRRLDIVRLVLAGPEPSGVADDPEAVEVLAELARAVLDLDPAMQSDVALVTLPMQEPRENALMVNALQRASSVVVQNSLREGFGLTVTEAMWKRIPVLSNRRACGPRHQVRDGVDGWLVDDPENTDELATALIDMLGDLDRADAWGHAAQRRVHDRFLVLRQLASFVDLLGEIV